MQTETINLTNVYQQYASKYPLYTQNEITEAMVEDGVITQEIAKKIKAGTPITLIDKSYFVKQNSDKYNIAENMGATFSKSKNPLPPKPNFNRQIEYTYQSNKQGDCWLLSDVNALNLTSWGKELLKNAIIPDTDNSGGVTIKFPGSPLPQKNFHISANEIAKAKKSGHYSTGDDDMIALELAVEKVSKAAVKAGIAKRVADFDEFIGYPSYLTNILLDKDKDKYLEISQLLTGRERISAYFPLNSTDGVNRNSIANIFKYIANNKEKVAAVCTFDKIKDAFGTRNENDSVHGNHAYAVKNVVFGKYVTVIDPYHSDKEINLSWKKFIEDVETIFVEGKDQKTNNELRQSLPKNYESVYRQNQIECHKSLAKLKKEQREREQKIIQDEIDRKTKQIIDDISWKLFDDDNKCAYNDVKWMLEKVDNDVVIPLLDKRPNLILQLDKYMSGWGNGKYKKALISPIIDALAKKGLAVGVNKNIVETFKTKCMKELNATLYTNEKIIQNEVAKMVKLIKQK